MGVLNVTILHVGYIDVIRNLPQSSVDKAFYFFGHYLKKLVRGGRLVLGKSVALIKEYVQWLWKPGA